MTLSEQQQAAIKAAADNSFPFVARCGVQTLEVARGYCKMKMPLAANLNHVGIMYAGALYTLAELPGGVIYLSSFDTARFYPIVKDMRIRFRRPATTDATVEVRISEADIERIEATALAHGKCDFEWDCQIKDDQGEVVALTHNVYQLRKIGA
ncbi:PaaI family thioesterase [Alloalcanivorax mobilis]|uniref:PaaI family thioesterase n=1 Tax=Alloalcanivorax mobilis TaxID=2019569 RepID=UPI000B5B3324|nr:YiiD C-terminal domain-containing protein [Alloalcanivorax mobilis]ASK35266.1 thioesterase [Alcanivorax sp. N3-2A]|tara:strand:+ start:36252 stop:36710 length:459 start_codon:yes stop_codon:yes gene_type:complete